METPPPRIRITAHLCSLFSSLLPSRGSQPSLPAIVPSRSPRATPRESWPGGRHCSLRPLWITCSVAGCHLLRGPPKPRAGEIIFNRKVSRCVGGVQTIFLLAMLPQKLKNHL